MAPKAAGRNHPVNCWYVAATSDEVGQAIVGRRLAAVGVAMYRTSTGEVVAFEDRCPHRAFPLSRGRLEGDRVVCGYHGLGFDPSGRCVHVPSQEHVPYGARLHMLPVQERPPYVWIWLGEPARAALRAPEEVAWLADPTWTVCGGAAEVAANYLLLHENFADVTHVPIVHPEISPEVLHVAAPTLEIDLTETSVWYSRNYPASAARALADERHRAARAASTSSASRARSSPPPCGSTRGRCSPPDPGHGGAPQLRRPLRAGGDARRRAARRASSGGSAATSPRTPAG